jgi:hypothetical protein
MFPRIERLVGPGIGVKSMLCGWGVVERRWNSGAGFLVWFWGTLGTLDN